MTLDDAEKLARIYADMPYETAACNLARFVMDVLPVVRAAEEWRGSTCASYRDCEDGGHDARCPKGSTVRSLALAIDQRRKEGG